MSQSTQNQNGPPAKKHPEGFSNPGPASRLTFPGSSSLANYLPAQNTSESGNNKLVGRLRCVEHRGMNWKTCFSERNEFPSSSARPSTSRVAPDFGDFSLDWLPIFKPNTNNNPPEFPSGSDGSLEVLSGGQKDDTPSIPGLGDDENPVPGRFVVSSEINQLKHTREPVAAILQSFGLEDGLKKLDPHILKQVNPAKLSCVLHQIFSKTEIKGKSSEPKPKLKSILKPNKVRDSSYAGAEKNNTGRVVDELPLDKESRTVLALETTSLATTAERLRDAIPATRHIISNSNTENKQKRTEKQKPRKQKNAQQKSELKLDERRQNKAAKKTQKDSSAKAPLGKKCKARLSFLSKLPSIVQDWVVKQMKMSEGKQPTLAMIEDYNGVTPRLFPHRCSLCDVTCQTPQLWLLHLNETNHVGNRMLLQLKSVFTSFSFRHFYLNLVHLWPDKKLNFLLSLEIVLQCL